MRYALMPLLCLFSFSASAQQIQLPNGLTAPQFLGHMLAVVAFCNYTNSVDQYEMHVLAKAIGITSADKSRLAAERTKHYANYRSHFDTLQKHQDFCSKIASHPFLLKALRRGVPTLPGSDDRRQPEKVAYFGEMLAKLQFCKAQIDELRWGSYLYEMGVKSESMQSLGVHAKKTRNEIVARYAAPQLANEMCAQISASLTKPW